MEYLHNGMTNLLEIHHLNMNLYIQQVMYFESKKINV